MTKYFSTLKLNDINEKTFALENLKDKTDFT
jgi:hypothetical protein